MDYEDDPRMSLYRSFEDIYESFGDFCWDYEDMDDVMEGIRMRDAYATAKAVQKNIKPGQYFISLRYGIELPEFGEILRLDKFRNKDEKDYIKYLSSMPHIRYYTIFVKSYTRTVPEGYIETFLPSDINVIIDKRLFDFYKKNGWQNPKI